MNDRKYNLPVAIITVALGVACLCVFILALIMVLN
jgi:hypothetical protein